MRWLAAMGLALALVSCGGGGGSSGGSDGEIRALPQQTLSALAQQEKRPSCSFERLYVTAGSVRVRHRVDGVEHWRESVLPAPQRIDLMNLGAGLLQALGLAPLPQGHYLEVRLVLADLGGLANAIQPMGGDLAGLSLGAASHSGLQLDGDFHVPPGQTADIALQGLDPCQSVVQTGPPGAPGYRLKPVLSATVQLIANAGQETAIASGTVMPLPGGGYVVSRQEGTSTWILQRHGADGQPAGAQAIITAPTYQGGFQPTSIAALPGGGYAAAWLELLEFDRFGGSIYHFFAQSFTETGAPVGSPLPIAQTVPGRYWIARPPAWPQVAALADGGYVVVWGLQSTVDTGVYAQRFNADGTLAGAVQQVTLNGGGSLGVTGLPAGGYLVTWGTGLTTAGGTRAYGADGLPLGPEQVAGPTWGPLFYPGDAAATSPLSGGGAVIAWVQRVVTGLHPVQGIFVQRLAPDGAPLGAVVTVDESMLPSEAYGWAAVAGLSGGGYVVAWIEAGEVHARRFAADGTAAGPETRVNLATTAAEGPVQVVGLADGGFMISWSGLGSDGVRANYARRFPASGWVTAS